MSDPIRDYLDALKAYEQERLKARKLTGLICQVANIVQYNLPDFISVSYGLPLPAGARDRFRLADAPAQINMSEWPDAATLRATLTAWHAAFVKLREAWEKIPEDDQKGMKEPPPTLFTG
jgi:hypothetical protein